MRTDSSIMTSEKTLTARRVKEKIQSSNPSRTKSQGPPPLDKKWRRNVILRQMKNHSISSDYNPKNQYEQPLHAINSTQKLKEWDDILQNFASKRKYGSSVSISSDSISAVMNRMGFSKYGYKLADKSPYACDDKVVKNRRRPVSKIVPRHDCFKACDSRVPSYMGWYWPRIFYEQAYRGWRPGAIPKNIRHIMCYFNGPCSCMPPDMKTCQTYKEKLRESSSETFNAVEKVVARKHTLKVVRKDGLYFVSMNPLKSSKDLNRTLNPYLDDCQPIQFQIALKRQNPELNEIGYLGYSSENPTIYGENSEMQNLLKILADECQNDSEFYDLAKTVCAKESDLDIEFFAPAANVSPRTIIHRETAYKETQYENFRKGNRESDSTNSVESQ